MSRDTWNPDSGLEMDVEALLARVLVARDTSALTGVTVTGGEPFDQASGLEELLGRIRVAWPNADILLYSGYGLAKLKATYARILRLADALISGPYVEGRATELPWRGSANQELTVLSDAAIDRYHAADPSSAPHLQVGADDDSVWIAGIPRRGDLGRLRNLLEDRGLVFGEVSWRP